MLFKAVLRHAFVAASFLAPIAATASQFAFKAIDEIDTVPGIDAWSYQYTVSGAFAPFGGFTLVFDAAKYDQIATLAGLNSFVWAESLVQPSPGLLADGLLTYTLISVAGVTLSDEKATVGFSWLGSGRPGAQPFEVFDESFNVVEFGKTIAQVDPSPPPLPPTGIPAPGTFELILGVASLGLGSLLRRRRR